MINFRKEKNIHPCYLKKSDLKDLAELIKDDFPKSERLEDFKISTYTDTVRISENIVDVFLSNKKLPEVLTKLNIEIVGWSNDRKIDKRLEINFNDSSIRLSVSGLSETWVNGKYLQIIDFLKTKRPFLWFIKSEMIFMLRGVIFGFMIMGGFLILKSILKDTSIDKSIILGTISLFILDWALSKFKYTKIYLTENKSFLHKNKEWIFFIITLTVTTIGIILDHKFW